MSDTVKKSNEMFDIVREFNTMVRDEYNKLIETNSDRFIRICLLTLMTRMKVFETNKPTKELLENLKVGIIDFLRPLIFERRCIMNVDLFDSFCKSPVKNKIINELSDILLMLALEVNLDESSPVFIEFINMLNFFKDFDIKEYLNQYRNTKLPQHDTLNQLDILCQINSLRQVKMPIPPAHEEISAFLAKNTSIREYPRLDQVPIAQPSKTVTMPVFPYDPDSI